MRGGYRPLALSATQRSQRPLIKDLKRELANLRDDDRVAGCAQPDGDDDTIKLAHLWGITHPKMLNITESNNCGRGQQGIIPDQSPLKMTTHQTLQSAKQIISG